MSKFNINDQEAVHNLIESYSKITEEGKHRVKVANVNEYSNGDQTHIVNFRAMTDWHEEQAVMFLEQGDFQEAINSTMSKSIYDGQYVPSNREVVDIVVEKVTTKNGVTGLFVTDIIQIPPAKPKKVDLKTKLMLMKQKRSEVVTNEVVPTEMPY